VKIVLKAFTTLASGAADASCSAMDVPVVVRSV